MKNWQLNQRCTVTAENLRWNGTLWSVWVVFAWCLLLSSASAIDVSDYKWGFNGKVSPHRFNVLSVLLNNPAPQPFDGEVLLRKSLGGAGTVDATLAEHVTLAPNSSKWVQFYPYITSDGGYSTENWAVSWRGGRYELPVPRIAKYQRIILDDPNSVTAKGGAVKFRFPDNLFPPFVTATDALQLVVLDHVPRWEESRRQSFLDWLYLGGTVVILQDASGKFPDFTGPLSVLKSPLEDQMYGSGRVFKVAMTRTQFSEDEFRQICAGLPKNFQAPNGEKSDDVIDKIDETQQVQQNPNYNFSEGTDPFKSTSFLTQLKQMTKPNHNWFLLHLMFWVYIAMIFPGCFLLGKKWSDFRVVYAGLLGTVALFSLLFSYVGQRGYGESTAVHTVVIAKPLPDGQMDVSSWANIFVTGGADYEIRHNAFGALYSTCNDHEQVKGIINNGAEAVFKVDIPPFSNRELATRAKLPFAGPKLHLTKFDFNGTQLEALEIEVTGLKQEDVEKQYALIGNTFYNLLWKDGDLVLANATGNVQGMLQVPQKAQQYPYGRMVNYNYGYDNHTSIADRYSQMFDLLLSRSLNVSRDKEAEQLRLPPNLMRVFLYAKMPGEFAVQNKRLGHQEGKVLYVLTLPFSDFKNP